MNKNAKQKEKFWRAWVQVHGAVCYYCDRSIRRDTEVPECKATIDHLIPLSKGGRDHQDNMVWSCLVCNNRKGDSLPLMPDCEGFQATLGDIMKKIPILLFFLLAPSVKADTVCYWNTCLALPKFPVKEKRIISCDFVFKGTPDELASWVKQNMKRSGNLLNAECFDEKNEKPVVDWMDKQGFQWQ